MTAALLALAAAIGWGTADFVAGRASRVAPAITVLAVSQLVGAGATLAALTVARPPLPSKGLVVVASLSGVALAVGLGSLYRGMQVGRISLVAPISATAAAIPLVWGIATGDVVGTVATCGLLVAFVGVVLASAESREGSLAVAAGVTFALLAALAGGAHIVLLDAASEDGVLWTLFIQRSTVAALAGGLMLRRGAGVVLSRGQVRPLVAIGLVDVAATASFAVATTKGQLSVVAVMGALYPVFTVLLAHNLLGERLSRLQRVGVTLALVAVLVLVAVRAA